MDFSLAPRIEIGYAAVKWILEEIRAIAINRIKKKILDIIIIGETTEITYIGHMGHFYNLLMKREMGQ